MKEHMTNKQFVMNGYLSAVLKGRIYPRYKQKTIRTPHGFVPNHVWNSYETAGSDRYARKVRELYPQFFETITRKEYYERYRPNIPCDFRSNWEMSRIKFNMVHKWNGIVKEIMK